MLISSWTQILPELYNYFASSRVSAALPRGGANSFLFLSPTQRHLSAMLSVQFFKATLLLNLQAEEAERSQLVQELKIALHRYLEPLFD